MKILIVEDDRDYRALLFEYLSQLGHDVLAVSDAIHAVALLNETDHKIDLVTLDMTMPRLSGETFMKSFAHWTACRTRFLIASANCTSDYHDHPKVAGFLQKPFGLEKLKMAIDDEAARQASAAGQAQCS